MTTDDVGAVSRILVPLELNRLSEAKIPLAVAQAKAFGAQVIIIHVIPANPSTDNTPTVSESQARSYLDAIATRLRGDGIQVESVVRFGSVADTILDEAAEQHADLIVIGNNVRRGISKLLLGSVAEELVARSACPVLVVRPNPSDAEKPLPVRSFDDDAARSGPVAPRHLGIRVVDVERIVGSVGRASELDSSFRIPSRRKIEQQRYEGIRNAMSAGEPLPPVVLYKLGYGYYVLDGNHRIAAARELKIAEMEADVTEFVPIGDQHTKRVFAERRAFERTTGLTRIGAAQPGNYKLIEDMIRAFAKEHPALDLRDAAQLWQEREFSRAAKRIRALRLGERLPGHRTADIVVEAANLREQVLERDGRLMDWEETVESLRDRLDSARSLTQADKTAVAPGPSA